MTTPEHIITQLDPVEVPIVPPTSIPQGLPAEVLEALRIAQESAIPNTSAPNN